MRETYDRAISAVLSHEGGYTNEASDPGGPTNWGITIADARMYWKPNATAQDVRNMPLAVAKDIYRKHYAAPIRYDELPAGVDYTVLDYGINSGIGRAGKVLRRVLKLADNSSVVTDGVIAVARTVDPVELINAINSERLAFLRSLKIWPVYGKGWGRRVAECRLLSTAMVKDVPATGLTNAPAPGKGHVSDPKAAKNGVAGAVVANGGLAGVYTHDSVVTLVVIAVVAVAAIGIAVYLIDRWREKKQEAAVPYTVGA